MQQERLHIGDLFGRVAGQNLCGQPTNTWVEFAQQNDY